MSLIYSASEAGFPPFFYSHNAKALLRGVAFDMQIKFQNYINLNKTFYLFDSRFKWILEQSAIYHHYLYTKNYRINSPFSDPIFFYILLYPLPQESLLKKLRKPFFFSLPPYFINIQFIKIIKESHQLQMPHASKIYQQTIKLFQDYQYLDDEIIHDSKLQMILNQCSEFALSKPFKKELFLELLSQCVNGYMGKVSPRNFASVVSQAQNILSGRIHQLEGGDGYIRIKQKEIIRLSEQIQKLRLRQISKSLALQIEELEEQKNECEEDLRELTQDLKTFTQERYILESIFLHYKFKPYRQIPSRLDKVYKSLSAAAYCAIICLLLQFLLSYIRHNQIAIIYYLHIICLLFRGYFHQKAGMFTILQNIASIFLDIAYFGAKYFYQYVNHEYRLINPIYFYFQSKYIIYALEIILVLTIIVRILMVIWLFKLREIFTEEERDQKKMVKEISYVKDVKHLLADSNNNGKPFDHIIKYQSSVYAGRKFNFLGSVYYINGKPRIRVQ